MNIQTLGSTFSKRYEKKFIANKERLSVYINSHKQFLKKHFDYDHILDDTNYTIIKNTYFDDSHLTSYHDSLLKKEIRHKVRARSYAENGIENDVLYFEIKSKINGETSKKRIALLKSWYNDFAFNNKINLQDIIEYNHQQEKEKVISIVNTLKDFIYNKNYTPMLINKYRRQAYKFKLDNKLRLTIDMDLIFQKVGESIYPSIEYNKIISNQDAIVEAKYKNPALYDSALFDLKKDILGESQSFSKYCYSIFQASLLEKNKLTKKDENLDDLVSEYILSHAALSQDLLKSRIQSI